MRLDQYEWSRNPRGMHVENVYRYPNLALYRQTGMGWIKFVAADVEYVDDAGVFMAAGITPCVRVYRPRMGVVPMTPGERSSFIAYARAGVRWFELLNEPNLGIEWPEGVVPDWRNAGMIAETCEMWLNWADFIISLGGYPGFPAMAESDAPDSAAVRWVDAMLSYIAANHRERFRRQLATGAYCATHPYILNHFYQERPNGGPRSARRPEELRAEEPGWHFEYPYDPISQADDPGRTVQGGTALTPYGDPVGLVAMGIFFNERCRELFGAANVPVLGTEGGIWDFPGPGEGRLQQDNRYPPYDNNAHAEATVAMFNWSALQAPPWFFGVTLWKEDIYLAKGNRALERLTQVPTMRKEVPPLDVFSGPPPAPAERGPGPIHGRADVHVVLLGQNLPWLWFFDTARRYWERFRPNVTRRTDFFENFPADRSLAVTVIAEEEEARTILGRLREEYPNTWVDLVVADSVDRVRQTLDARADVGRRF